MFTYLLKHFKAQCHYVHLVSFGPWGHCTYLVMLNTYHYVSLCGTRMEHHHHFFLDYPQNHYFNLGLGFGPNM